MKLFFSCYVNIQENHGISKAFCGFLIITFVCVLNMMLCMPGNPVHLVLHNYKITPCNICLYV